MVVAEVVVELCGVGTVFVVGTREALVVVATVGGAGRVGFKPKWIDLLRCLVEAAGRDDIASEWEP